MTASETEQISRLVDEYDWLIGAVNYDEDLHFSSYYLRASVPRRTATFYPGYSNIFAFYREFSERYYLRTDECAANAQAIIRRATRDPSWLEGTLDEIIHRSDRLWKVFDPKLNAETLEAMSDDEILSLYKKHHSVHSDLYTYARIPEALDRGINAFTNYLKEYLSKAIPDVAEREEAFIDLTQPVTPSVLAQELLGFDRIVRWTSHDHNMKSLLLTFPRKAHLLLSQSLLSRIERHVERWKYLEYHGYGSRNLTSKNEIIERLVVSLQDESRDRRAYGILNRLAANRIRKEELFRKLKIDSTHRALFELYPEIGAAKLYRRYTQLRNFFFFDMLLADISRRVGVDEWTLRCMLPEEIIATLGGQTERIHDALERRNGCLIVFWNEQEIVRVGDQVRLLEERLEAQASEKTDRRILKGVIASRGKAQGTCKIVIRSDGAATQFEKGGILVSEATDPDLLKFLKVAGGVLTQQGGVTSHAALICREIGIPAIIGIEGLLDKVKDGDVVELDGYTGEVRLVGSQEEPPPGLVFEPGLADDGKIGAKATNLTLLSNRGFNVPLFVLLQFDGVQKLVCSSAEAPKEQFLKWITRRIGLKGQDTIAIRSSSVTEDLRSASFAGEFESVLRVPLNEFWNKLAVFFEKNQIGKTGTEYSGSIIMQRMIDGVIGGVCLTGDIQNGRDDVLTLEMAAGGSEAVTSGTDTPRRISINKDTRDVIEHSGKLEGKFEIVSTKMSEFLRTFLDVEEVFGYPVDIEWLWDGELLHIVQARPIAAKRLVT